MKYQQGDVWLETIAKDSTFEKIKDGQGIILAEGEATGHMHRVKERAELYRDKNGQFYLSAHGPVTITHEEHKPITIPGGFYKVGIVQEYDYIGMQSRRVED